MYIVLLSGGSGKRLWPLSNDLCSKQYIKLMNHDEEQENREKWDFPRTRSCAQAARRWN